MAESKITILVQPSPEQQQTTDRVTKDTRDSAADPAKTEASTLITPPVAPSGPITPPLIVPAAPVLTTTPGPVTPTLGQGASVNGKPSQNIEMATTQMAQQVREAGKEAGKNVVDASKQFAQAGQEVADKLKQVVDYARHHDVTGPVVPGSAGGNQRGGGTVPLPPQPDKNKGEEEQKKQTSVLMEIANAFRRGGMGAATRAASTAMENAGGTGFGSALNTLGVLGIGVAIGEAAGSAVSKYLSAQLKYSAIAQRGVYAGIRGDPLEAAAATEENRVSPGGGGPAKFVAASTANIVAPWMYPMAQADAARIRQFKEGTDATAGIFGNLAQYSPEMAKAQAMAEVRKTLAEMDIAKAVGPEGAKFIDTKSRYETRSMIEDAPKLLARSVAQRGPMQKALDSETHEGFISEVSRGGRNYSENDQPQDVYGDTHANLDYVAKRIGQEVASQLEEMRKGYTTGERGESPIKVADPVEKFWEPIDPSRKSQTSAKDLSPAPPVNPDSGGSSNGSLFRGFGRGTFIDWFRG